MAQRGGSFDRLRVDELTVLVDCLGCSSILALSGTSHAFWDGTYSRAQQGDRVVQVVRDAARIYRAEQLRGLELKVGPDLTGRIPQNWAQPANVKLAPSDVCMIAGLCVFELHGSCVGSIRLLGASALNVSSTLHANRINTLALGKCGPLLLSRLIPFNASLTSANLLSNRFSAESANMLLEVKTKHAILKTLCELTHEETELNLFRKGLGLAMQSSWRPSCQL